MSTKSAQTLLSWPSSFYASLTAFLWQPGYQERLRPAEQCLLYLCCMISPMSTHAYLPKVTSSVCSVHPASRCLHSQPEVSCGHPRGSGQGGVNQYQLQVLLQATLCRGRYRSMHRMQPSSVMMG